ncbi:TolC family outer membrane protein [Vibrio sp. HN007]|uniref:TolC family outer membrane protein n=1 Tax=Vibrio iocasae TaxID=3098914 RepID=UPI0035D50935
MKWTRLSTLGCLVSLSFGVHSQTLEQAIATTITSNPDIKGSYNDFKSYVEANNVSSGAYLPNLDLDAGIGYEKIDPATGNETELTRKEAIIRLTQLLWDGSATIKDIDRTAAEAESMRYQLIADAQDLALEVSNVYLNAVKAQEVLTLSERNLEVHQKIYKDIKRRVDSGIGSTADLSQVEARISNANSNLIAAQNNVIDVYTQFTKLVGESPQDLISPRPDEETIPSTLDDAALLSEANHPVLKVAAADVQAAKYQYEQSKGTNYPTFSIEASHGLYDDADGRQGRRDETSAMLRMRYNLFNGGSDAAEQDRMAYQLNKAKDLRDSSFRNVNEGLRLSWSAMELTVKQQEFLSQNVDSTSDTVIAYEKQYRIGQRTLLDLLNTENELFEARKNYLDAKYDGLYAKYRVLNATGTLLDALLVDIPQEWNEKVE